MEINEQFVSDETIIRQLLRDEQEAIANYNKAVDNIGNEFARDVLISIMEEEKVHVGELLEVLESLGCCDKRQIKDGKKEAREIMHAKELENVFDRVMHMINDMINV